MQKILIAICVLFCLFCAAAQAMGDASAVASDAIPLQNAFARAVRIPSEPGAWGGQRSNGQRFNGEGKDSALSDRVVSYQIVAQLDPERHLINGQQTLRWRNRSHLPISTVYLHLYLNAFANADSTFMQEDLLARAADQASSKPDVALGEGEWGSIKLLSCAQMGVESSPKMRFVQPDGGPATDQTVLALDLAQSVPAGGELTLEMHFASQLPRVIARTGYFGTFHMGAQWFPKIAVLELPGERGAQQVRWNAHEFHLNSEFYADFGTFDVKLTVPKDYRVAATGKQLGAAIPVGEELTYHFAQNDVHDFAFAADRRFAPPLVEVYQRADLSQVQLSVFFTPDFQATAKPAMAALKAALRYAAQTLEEYPFETVTIIVPPFNAEDAGGMEYPTLFTIGGFAQVLPGSNEAQEVEFTTTHEFFHNYFQGILASNEIEEPMLDEGVNEFWNVRQLREAGRRVIVPGVLGWPGINVTVDGFELRRIFAQLGDPQDDLGENAWRRWSTDSFFNVYSHTALVLRDLEQRWGAETMTRAMRTYVQRWKFRHPSTADFQSVLAEVSQDREHLAKVFDELIYSTGVIDDRIVGLSSWREENQKGDSAFRTVVSLRRFGIGLPQTVRVNFSDGSSQVGQWRVLDTPGRWAQLQFLSSTQAQSAELDPAQRYYIDRFQMDNSRVLKANSAASVRWTAESMGLLSVFSSLLFGL